VHGHRPPIPHLVPALPREPGRIPRLVPLLEVGVTIKGPFGSWWETNPEKQIPSGDSTAHHVSKVGLPRCFPTPRRCFGDGRGPRGAVKPGR
jgi:hypothetical protein